MALRTLPSQKLKGGNAMTYSDYAQRELDIASGRELDRRYEATQRRRSLTGAYCRDCGGRMTDGHHIDPLDDVDHAAVAERGES